MNNQREMNFQEEVVYTCVRACVCAFLCACAYLRDTCEVFVLRGLRGRAW